MKAPAFQFYADDFLGGTCDMTAEEVGAYIRLLCHQWNKGGIPNDPERLARMAGVMPGPSLGYASAKFRLCEDGVLRNDRMEAERVKQQQFRARQGEKGKRGADTRWKNGAGHAPAMPVLCPGYAPAMPVPIPEHSSPSPSPSPKEEEEPKKRKSFDVSAIEIPEALNTAGFLNAWDRWCDHRREMKKPLTKTSTEHQLKELAGMGESRAIAALHHSVKNGWQGIYEPTKTATASEVPSGPRSWRNTPSSEWTPEDHAAYEKA